LTELIKRLEARNIRVGVIKHDGSHDFEIDRPGKDTWRYRQAGASLVAIQSSAKTAFIEHTAVPLPQLVQRMAAAGAELILVEGFKRADYRKIVMIREQTDAELLDLVTGAIAVVSWQPFVHPSLPVFAIDDYDGITAYLLSRLGGKETASGS
jgi:molybdopterin-guanine dinucleotide biosynthesis protein B